MEEGISQDIYSEVYSVLNLLGDYYINTIPKSLYKMICERKNNEYHPQYNSISDLNKKNIKKETLSLVCLLQKNYWDYGLNIDTIIKSNEKIISEKYNHDNIFKNKFEDKKKEKIEETGLIQLSKDTWYNKVIKFFNKLLKRMK